MMVASSFNCSAPSRVLFLGLCVSVVDSRNGDSSNLTVRLYVFLVGSNVCSRLHLHTQQKSSSGPTSRVVAMPSGPNFDGRSFA